jgi:drug/metabolite transporter (DMT)-like permease
LNLLPFLLIIGLIEVAYLFPYYKALEDDDTSIVASLFVLGDIFVPVLAFLIVGEALYFHQYLGFFIIVLSGFLLSFNGQKRFRFNKSLLYMFVCSLMLAVEVVLYKYVFEKSGWSVGFIWPNIFAFLFAVSLFLFPKRRQGIKSQFVNFKRKLPIFAFEELLTFGGSMAATYAIFLVPVTLEKGISALQPIFVLLYAIILSKFFPNLFKEKIDKASIFKKVVLFVIMTIGVILIL